MPAGPPGGRLCRESSAVRVSSPTVSRVVERGTTPLVGPAAGGVAVTHDTRGRRRNPHRAAGVGTERDHRGAFKQTHPGARRGAARSDRIVRAPRVQGRPGVGVEADAAEGELDGVRLADDHPAQPPHRAHQEALAPPPLGELAARSRADGEPLHAVQILDRNGDPGQGARIVAARHGLVDVVGLTQGALGVEDDVGVEIAPFMPLDGGFGDGAGGGPSRADLGCDHGDGRWCHGVVWSPVRAVEARKRGWPRLDKHGPEGIRWRGATRRNVGLAARTPPAGRRAESPTARTMCSHVSQQHTQGVPQAGGRRKRLPRVRLVSLRRREDPLQLHQGAGAARGLPHRSVRRWAWDWACPATRSGL